MSRDAQLASFFFDDLCGAWYRLTCYHRPQSHLPLCSISALVLRVDYPFDHPHGMLLRDRVTALRFVAFIFRLVFLGHNLHDHMAQTFADRADEVWATQFPIIRILFLQGY
jgi:hypothetical protein